MSTQWPRDHWRQAVWESSLPSMQKLIALVYADHAGRKASAWVTNERLANLTSSSERSVARHRAMLVESGWLTQHSAATQHRSPIFDLTYPDPGVPDCHPSDSTRGDNPAGLNDSRGANLSARGANLSAQGCQIGTPSSKTSEVDQPTRAGERANGSARCPDCDDDGWVLTNPDDPTDRTARRCSHPRRAA